MSWLNKLAERQIARARATGQLQGLAGEGKPLPDRSADAFVSAGDAMGFRIMAEAGVLPEEIVLKKQAQKLRDHLARLTDPDARRAVIAALSETLMKQAIAEEARKRFLRD